jgi:hypothetical protein
MTDVWKPPKSNISDLLQFWGLRLEDGIEIE